MSITFEDHVYWIFSRSIISIQREATNKMESTLQPDSKFEPNEENEIDVHLIRWEEFALTLEEHFHANQLYKKNPNNKPLGHR